MSGFGGVIVAPSLAYDEVPAGTLLLFCGATIPGGYLECDGSAVSRDTYALLFAAIGTTWGVGDGSTTFDLPDLRGRAPIGVGTGAGLTARALADTVGAETHQLVVAETPSHQHVLTSNGAPIYNNATGGSGANDIHNDSGQNTGGSQFVNSAIGGDGAHQNMQPVAAVKMMVKT